MIGNIHKSGNSFSGASEYVLAQGRYAKEEKDKKPEIIEQNNIFSTNHKEIGREMRAVALDNTKVKKPVMHYSVSFSKDDKTEEFKRIEAVKSTMKDLGISEDNHQYMVVKHNDKQPHYHIIVNRVGLDGKLLSDNFSKNRLEVAIDKAEKKLGLDNSLAEKRRFVYNPANDKGYEVVPRKENILVRKPKDKQKSLSDKKEFVQKKINESLQNKKISNPEQLKSELQKYNIKFEYKINSKGLAGTSFHYDKLSVKGSQIDFKASVIEKQLKYNEKFPLLHISPTYKMEQKTEKIQGPKNDLQNVNPMQQLILDQINTESQDQNQNRIKKRRFR